MNHPKIFAAVVLVAAATSICTFIVVDRAFNLKPAPIQPINVPAESPDTATDWQALEPATGVSMQIPNTCRIDAAAGSRYIVCPTTEYPTPTPSMVISSDGQNISIRRWEGIAWEHWDAAIASIRITPPLTSSIKIEIEQ